MLPRVRAQGGGAIVQMSSVGGQITAPGFGAYCATKVALEGITQALHDEVAPFGIRTLIVQLTDELRRWDEVGRRTAIDCA